MRIIICDDNQIQLEIMNTYITDYLTEKNLLESCELLCFSNGDSVNEKVDELSIDVAFLDIEMEGLSGINLSRIIREKYPNAIIIFVTGFKEHAITAFSVRALDYVIKPISVEKLNTLLDEVVKIYNENIKINIDMKDIKYYSFKRNKKLVRIPYHEIGAFEKIDRKVRLHSLSGVFEFIGTFKQLIDEIDMDNFIQCHQSYIVNKSFVKSFSNPDILMDEIGLKVPVNRNSKKMVRQLIKSN